MTDRAIFNRRYTSYTPGSSPVWLVNGAGVTTSVSHTQELTAGATLVQGEAVYVSGVYALPASAASGVASEQFNAIGITAEAAVAGSGVAVNLDDIVLISDENITAEASLVPGQYYYLSQYPGQITRFSTASGTITAASGYAALVTMGLALSPSELHVEIEAPIDLYA